MTLEIRQMVIRATVTGQAGQAPAVEGSATGRAEKHQREDLVQEVVDQVMQVLEDRKAR